jgi:hypothetical protein
MRSPISSALLLSLLAQIRWANSFAPAPNNINVITSKTTMKSSSSMNMIPLEDVSAISSASNFISTISADIDNIPQDNFAQVFAGGIAVMIGGVLSTVMVGFLLESGNSYASVVADSYVQGGDEEFWESLSPEDQVKTRELMEKLRQSKEQGKGNGDKGSSDLNASEPASSSETAKDASSKGGQKKEEISMFSDYEED